MYKILDDFWEHVNAHSAHWFLGKFSAHAYNARLYLKHVWQLTPLKQGEDASFHKCFWKVWKPLRNIDRNVFVVRKTSIASTEIAFLFYFVDLGKAELINLYTSILPGFNA